MRTLFTIVLLGFCLVTIGQAASPTTSADGRLTIGAMATSDAHHLSLTESATDIVESDVEVDIPEAVDNLFAAGVTAPMRLLTADRSSDGAIHAPPIYLAVRSLLI